MGLEDDVGAGSIRLAARRSEDRDLLTTSPPGLARSGSLPRADLVTTSPQIGRSIGGPGPKSLPIPQFRGFWGHEWSTEGENGGVGLFFLRSINRKPQA